MLRTCPRCGDYYADAPSAFCPADGAPLVDLDPSAETWSEATRVVRERGEAVRKQTRRLRRRRVWMTLMTTLMLTMVVFVVVVNTYIYLRPQREENSLPADTPTGGDGADADDGGGGGGGGGGNGNVNVNLNVNLNVNVNRNANANVSVDACSALDRKRELAAIERKYRDELLPAFKREQRSVMDRSPRLWFRAELIPGKISFKPTFSKTCTAASVTVTYVWKGKVPNPDDTHREVPITFEKKLACEKARGEWRCR